MKKIFVLAMTLLAAVTLPIAAQDTYESAKLMENELNGTARYVGMGGALDALGADLSTISTNPAGIGLFRHSTASVSLSVISQQEAQKFDHLNKTNFSFDQIGFVYTSRTGYSSFVNFALNYHKGRNFDQLLSAANSLRNASLNKLAYAKYYQGRVGRGGYSLDWNRDNDLMGYEDANSDYRAQTYSQWDYLMMNAVNAETGIVDGKDNTTIGFNDADAYNYDRATRGWISDFDFNISGNINDRVYLGLTVGVHDVNYKHYSEYSEGLIMSDGSDAGVVTLADERKVTGTGYDVKAGIIFRPIEYSPFRIGFSVSTPTWYSLKSDNYTMLFNNSLVGDFDEGQNGERYEFKFFTPWKFGLSFGHTIGTQLALGAGIDYADYSASDARINDGYDYYGEPDSYSDRVMRDNIDHSLKGVATVRVGAELKPDPQLAVRLGYNYVSPMYKSDGVRDMTLDSPAVMYASTADYTNWKATNRITCGIGYKTGDVNIDLGYQYSTTNGTFYPFQPDFTFDGESNVSTPTSVSHKRHQVLLTLGYTF